MDKRVMRLLGLIATVAVLCAAQGNRGDDLRLTQRRRISFSTELIPDFVYSGNAVAVTDDKTNSIAVYNIQTGRVIERVPSTRGTEIEGVFRAGRAPLLASVNRRYPKPDEISVFETGSTLRKRFSVNINEVVSNVAFSWSGDWVAVADPDYANRRFDVISIYSTDTDDLVRTFQAGLPRTPNRTLPKALAFSPDDTLLAVGDEGGGVSIFEIARLGDANVTPIRGRFAAHARDVSYMEFSPDGKILVTGDQFAESVVLLWDTETWQPKQPIRLTSNQIDRVHDLKFHPTRPLLAISGVFKVAIYDTRSGKEVWKNEEGVETGFDAVDFSQDGKFFGFVSYPRDLDKDGATLHLFELQ